MTTSAQTLTYRASLTPVIDSVSPRRGGTAGGSIITIEGRGLSGVQGQASVSIDGVACTVRTANDSVITCRTGAHRTTLSTSVLVSVPGKGTSVGVTPTMVTTSSTSTGSASFQYVDRWSSVYTWGGNPPPKEGESVSIRKGQTLLLDISPTPTAAHRHSG